jgi:hypothetical protein
MSETRTLRLYLIERTDDVDYEQDAGKVVAAYTRQQARELAAQHSTIDLDERARRAFGLDSFLDPRRSKLTQIGVHVSAHGGKPAEPYVVLTDNRGM